MRMDNEEFLTLPAVRLTDSKHEHPLLTTERKRHRRSNKGIRHNETSTVKLKIKGTVLSDGNQEVAVGPTRLRELLTEAVKSMFGEHGNNKRFQWDLVSYDQTKKVGTVRLTTIDLVGFRAALALFCAEDARLRIIEG
jgi:hypothetical protein